ncbi:MAG: hypothetical protein DWQ07_01090 [Chloroflexi bacterium]|nr:MAG: hypothetical protein DWQ07_01090 [Chloroflexota bacterium]MBL1196522.1 hypothetical protein [Chloroflexota bacterium]NOH13818.1 hypothetical protein [Chloroflexota bacterium]
MGEMIPFNANSLYAQLQNSLKAWEATSLPIDALKGLLTIKQITGDPQGSLRQFIVEQIDALEKENKQHADLLRLRFFEGATIKEVAHERHLSRDQVNRQQRRAIEHLAELIYQKETALRQERLQDIQKRLPSRDYTQLFGNEKHKQLLAVTLLDPDKYHMVALVGMGGIGKTSLADITTREIAPSFHFADIFWLRFPQNNLSEPPSHYFVFNWVVSKLASHFQLEEHSDYHQFLWVRQYLNQARYLIVIDNLHNETQTPELFKKLEEFAVPSKILLTARVRPAPQSTVFSIMMNEIDLKNATDLLVHQLDAIGQRDKAAQVKEHMPEIYATTGGNPLALKLCAGLLYSLPLPIIIDEMEQRHIRDIHDLYAYIYFELWKGLSENAQILLEAMPLADDIHGASLEHIASVTKLPEKDVHHAIQELSQASLIEPRGSIEERRYSIHQLTRGFLLKEIIVWDKGPQ